MCGIKTASLFSMRMDLYADGCEKNFRVEQDFQAERNGHSADSAERGFYAVFRVQPGAYKS